MKDIILQCAEEVPVDRLKVQNGMVNKRLGKLLGFGQNAREIIP